MPDRLWACPLCRREGLSPELLLSSGLEPAVIELVAVNTPGWRAEMGLCPDCARRFTSALAHLRAHGGELGPQAILPTPVRLGALEEYRGRGVTIAFLDSGFYAHPDLTQPDDRILAYVDLTSSRGRPRQGRAALRHPDASSWHGMMTSVVACGNGRLSRGLYRGIASGARVVLVKCGSLRRIAHDDIRRGLDWVVRNRRRFGIRVVNLSCGGDYQASYLTDGLSQAAERATREGLLVCAAVGNLGGAPGHPVLPPASAPSVLTVGGLDDKNRLSFSGYDLYHSSYGPTLDGLQKPEVVAPGIWVAAPILPDTPTADQAALLTQLARTPDAELRRVLAARSGVDPDLDAALRLDTPLLRELVTLKLRDNKVISGAYKHVDGTSFAAPIVSSIAAQMLEANPGLGPLDVKRILIGTARRIGKVEVDRQGWGVVDPGKAVEAALDAGPRKTSGRLSAPR